MESLFIIQKDNGNVLIEKHWKKVISSNIINTYYTRCLKEERIPIYNTSQYLLIHISVADFFFVAVNERDVPPLMVLEFLYKIVEVFKIYIGDITEFNIKENYVIIYQLLEEMLDYGFPLITDANGLKDIIAPPTMINKVISKVTGKSNTHDKLLSGSLSNIAWRKNGIVYKNNEIYFDIVEEIDAILSNDGSVVSCEINGSILSNCKLSGMPDLSVTFNQVNMIDDCSFHPCVRHEQFKKDKTLLFIPPDGQFKLMSYRTALAPYHFIPLTLIPKLSKVGEGGRFEFTLHAKFQQNKAIENIIFSLKVSKDISNVIAHPNLGSFVLDHHEQMLLWKIDKLNPKDKVPVLNGTYTSQTNKVLNGVAHLNFTISNLASSNLKIDSLKVLNQSYKPYKGVRAITKAGSFQVRI